MFFFQPWLTLISSGEGLFPGGSFTTRRVQTRATYQRYLRPLLTFLEACFYLSFWRHHGFNFKAKSYEDVFKRNTDFIKRSIRNPEEVGSRLLGRNCLSFDDLTRIGMEESVCNQAQVLIDAVLTKDCFVDFLQVLSQDRSPVADYLEIKRNSTEFVSDAEFVKKLGMKGEVHAFPMFHLS